jgi:hypothetical protein
MSGDMKLEGIIGGRADLSRQYRLRDGARRELCGEMVLGWFIRDADASGNSIRSVTAQGFMQAVPLPAASP